jgi:hypothetical protein
LSITGGIKAREGDNFTGTLNFIIISLEVLEDLPGPIIHGHGPGNTRPGNLVDLALL